LVDLETNRTIQDADTWTKVGWTPYAGRSLTGWPIYTIVDGKIVHSRSRGEKLRGDIVASPGSTGRPLIFE
jgi:dihydroorotase